MNDNLARLISDYQHRVRAALVLLKQSGIPMPDSNTAWAAMDIPFRDQLEGGISYFKHGIGCAVSLVTGPIDFDFGDDGEIDGVDLDRLTRFAGPSLEKYGFDTEDSLAHCFKAAVASGALIYSGYILYYLANRPRALAVDVDD